MSTAPLSPEWPICPEKKFFQENHWYNFHYLLAPFIVQNFTKIFRVDPELWRHVILWAQNGPIVIDNFFSRKIINIISIHFLTSFTMKNSKNSLEGTQIYVQCIIFGPKMTHLLWRNFFLRKAIDIIFMYPLGPFIVQNFEKIFRTDSELWRHIIFWAQNLSIVLYEKSFQNNNIILMYFLTSLIVDK